MNTAPKAKPFALAGSAHLDVFAQPATSDGGGTSPFVDTPGEVTLGLGGTAFNALAALRQRGAPCRFWTALNDGMVSGMVEIRLNELGVDSFLQRDRTLPDAAFVATMERGEMSAAVSSMPVDRAVPTADEANMVVAGAACFLADGNLSASALDVFFAAAKRNGVPTVWLATSDAKVSRLLEVENKPDAVFLNRREVAVLSDIVGTTGYSELAAHLGSTLIITRDAEGAAVVTPQDVITVSPPHITQVANYFGAGDALAAEAVYARFGNPDQGLLSWAHAVSYSHKAVANTIASREANATAKIS